jgi:hypothetical protein
VNRAVVHGQLRKASDVVRIDIDKGRRGYRVAYMIGNLSTESIIRALGELCEVTI